MSFITRTYGAAKLLAKANGPTVMVVAGVVAMGVGAVLACKQTLKVEEVMAKHAPSLDDVVKAEELNVPSYTKEVATQDRIKIYTRAGLDLGKLYGVPLICFGAGAGLVFGGHHIMLKRNATLALAFTGLKKAFDRYRLNVVEEFGSQADQAMYSGHIVKTVVDPETGEKEVINTRDWEGSSQDMYNRVFEEGASTQWKDDLGINKMFIAQQQRFAQIKLGHQGYLYLSEVYEALGFPESDVSRVVGWKVIKHPDGTKSIPNVDFGLDKRHPDDWKYNQTHAIYLDFNCQGLIIGGKVQKALEQA